MILGTLNSTPNSTFRVEFFSNTHPDTSGYGEGEQYLGFANVRRTPAATQASFSLQIWRFPPRTASRQPRPTRPGIHRNSPRPKVSSATDYVIGTSGSDTIVIDPGTLAGTLKATVNGVTQDNIEVSMVLGLGGNDTIIINASLNAGSRWMVGMAATATPSTWATCLGP